MEKSYVRYMEEFLSHELFEFCKGKVTCGMMMLGVLNIKKEISRRFIIIEDGDSLEYYMEYDPKVAPTCFKTWQCPRTDTLTVSISRGYKKEGTFSLSFMGITLCSPIRQKTKNCCGI